MVSIAGTLKNARSERRHELALEVSRPGSGSMGWTRDVSGGGLKVECAVPLQPGKRVRLELSFPQFLEPFAVEGAVIWTGTIDECGRRGCGVRVFREIDRQRLDALAQTPRAPRRSHRVLVADPRAFHHPQWRFLGERVPELDVTVVPTVDDAVALRDRAPYDTVLLDAELRDRTGAHILSELLIGDGSQYDGLVFACSRNPSALKLAEHLGAAACLTAPVQYERVMGTLDRLLRRRSSSAARRVDFV